MAQTDLLQICSPAPISPSVPVVNHRARKHSGEAPRNHPQGLQREQHSEQTSRDQTAGFEKWLLQFLAK